MPRENMRRREFLAGMAVAGADALLGGGLSAQQRGRGGRGAGNAPSRPIPPDIKNTRGIDVHHHYAPPGWLKVLAEQKALNVEPWMGWSPAKAIEAMDRAGVQLSYSSITVPGIYFAEGFGNQQAPPGAKFKNDVVALAREANEFGARMKSDHPGRFGIWASLPLPDVDASLKEIDYAFDKLKLDGIGLITSIGTKYMGDKSFAPVFDELNRRNAIVYTHPGAGPCCLYALPGVGPTTLEYSHDTARTIVSWVSSGSAERFPNVKWIFSHGGGSIWSARYIGGEIGTDPKTFANRTQAPRLLSFLRKFYYDTAASSNFLQMENLKTLVGTSQIVLGSDHPYGDPLTYVLDLRELQASGVFTPQERQAIERENATRLLASVKT
jgi:predicted TIM-barrel fold metal-dependent hydrolase